MKKSIWVPALASTLMISLAAGCGGTKTTSPQENGSATNAPAATAKADEKVTLKIVGNANEMKPAIEAYKTVAPNVTINVIDTPWGSGGKDTRDKQLIMLSSGDIPDIGKMVWGKEFLRKGIIEDVTAEIKTWDIYSRYTPGQLERISIDGKHVGPTMGNNSIFLYYNKDLLAKVGAEAPKTIDEMVEIAKKVKAANLQNSSGKPVYTVSFEGGNWATDYWLWSLGGSQMNEDYSKTLIDSPESVKAYQTMQDFVKNGWAPKNDMTNNQLWLNGQLVFWPSGEWDLKATKGANINYGVSVMPKGPTGKNTTSIGGIEYGVFKASKNKKEALAFLKWMAGPDLQSIGAGSVSDIKLYDLPAKQEAWKKEGMLETKLVQRDQLQSTKYNFLEAPFVYPEGAKIYTEALEKVLVKLDDPAVIMKEAATKINAGIEKANK